jgi:hypothetical protein
MSRRRLFVARRLEIDRRNVTLWFDVRDLSLTNFGKCGVVSEQTWHGRIRSGANFETMSFRATVEMILAARLITICRFLAAFIR